MKYGKIENGVLRYFEGNSVKVMQDKEREVVTQPMKFEIADGKPKVTPAVTETIVERVEVRVFNPNKETLAEAGYYPVVDIADDGTDAVITRNGRSSDGDTNEEGGNTYIAHYTGKPIEPSEKDMQIASLERSLSNTEELFKAMERIIAANGATDEDKAMAQHRIEMRYELDELGKIIAPEEPDGSYLAPFRYVDGMEVQEGFFYAVDDPDDAEHPFIKEAIKSGVPANGNDNEYFD